jgi:hypothetical protein
VIMKLLRFGYRVAKSMRRRTARVQLQNVMVASPYYRWHCRTAEKDFVSDARWIIIKMRNHRRLGRNVVHKSLSTGEMWYDIGGAR